jgi:hypothetical protein
VQSGSYVIEHTSYSTRHAEFKFTDTNSCYLVAYLPTHSNSSTFRMNEMKPSAGAGEEVWCGWKSEVLQYHCAFSVPVVTVNLYIIPRFLPYDMSVHFGTGWQIYTQYTVSVKGHTHLCTLQFLIIGNPNMTAMQTCEAGPTVALPTAQ